MIVTFPVVPADIILTEFIDELFVLLATVTVSVYTNMGWAIVTVIILMIVTVYVADIYVVNEVVVGVW